MECSICRVRGAIGFCVTCERMLCEMCGTLCSGCGKVVCRNHRRITRSGKILCKPCSEEREERKQLLQGIEGSAPGAIPQTGLSFAELQAELDVMLGESNEEKEEVPDYLPDATALDSTPYVPVDKPKETEFRILTASAPKETPVWLKTFGQSLIALVFVMIVGAMDSDAALFQPWFSYGVILLSLGILGYAVHGMRQRSAPLLHRRLCWMGVILSLLAMLIALAIRVPAAPY